MRADPQHPSAEELDRERRDRYAAERENPTGLLAAQFRAYAQALAAEQERLQREENLRREDDQPVTMSSPPRQLVTEADFDYHSIALNTVEPDYDDPHLTDRRVDKLVTVTRSGLVIHSGIASGPVRLHLHAATAEPTVDADQWETLAEVPVSTPTGRILFQALFTDGAPEVNMATSGPGTYCVRIGNRGYGVAYDESVEVAVEDILVQVWPTNAPASRP